MDEKFDKRELDSIFEEIKKKRKNLDSAAQGELDIDFEIAKKPSQNTSADDTIQLKPVDLQRIREERAAEAKRIEQIAREQEERERIAEQNRKQSNADDELPRGFKVNVRYFNDDEDEEESFDLPTAFGEPDEGTSGDFLSNFNKIKENGKKNTNPFPPQNQPAKKTPIAHIQSLEEKHLVAEEFSELKPFKVDFDEDPEILYENEYADELSELHNSVEKGVANIPEGFEHVKGKFGTLEASADKIIREIYDWAETLLAPILAIIVTLTFFIRTSEVIGVSMQPTLFNSERLLVYQIDYEPSYGDVVVVQADNLPNERTGLMGESIVKRVIGLSGDQIFIEPETGMVYRNGKALTEPYIAEAIDIFHLGTQSYPLTVPDGCVFLLGDNRNNSTDSRWGYYDGAPYYVDCVEEEYVIGKCFFRLWPLDKIGVIE